MEQPWKEILKGNEPKILHDNQHLIHSKINATAQKELGEGFSFGHHDATVSQTRRTQAAPSSIVDSSTDAGYDPEKAQLQKSTVISPIPNGTHGSTPAHAEVQTKEGILLTSSIFQRVNVSPFNVTNLSLYFFSYRSACNCSASSQWLSSGASNTSDGVRNYHDFDINS